MSFALRGSLVRESARFALNELRGSSAVATYRLRSSGIAVTVRHGTADVLVLDSVFSQGEYELAAPVEATLAARRMPLRVVDLGANIGLFGAYIL
ncbi:MAG: hypothetical protein M3188_07645, partial [Actinomycetota bacterium]|nr:hypothetical protein [Actinomycetota bacterium]